MNRKIFYPGSVPLSETFLDAERQHMIGLGYAMQAVLGVSTIVDGLACTGMTPATLTIQVGPGQIYALASLDGAAYGILAADIAHNVVKQGVNIDPWTATLAPPGIAGQAVNYLIQAAFVEADTDNKVLPYVNAANPSVPFTGPNNSGAVQPQTRKCSVLLSAKSGIADVSGSQVTPVVDAGYVPLYVVTVTYGQTQITGANISAHPAAPFLYKKLPELPLWVQGGAYAWGDDTGTANAIAVNLAPAPNGYSKGMRVVVKKINAANTGNVTININGIGAVAVIDPNGAQLAPGAMTANMVMHLVCDGTAFRFMNGSTVNTTVNSLTGVSGEGVQVDSTNHINLNFPGLDTSAPILTDRFPFYRASPAAGKTHHETCALSDILAIVTPTVGETVLHRYTDAYDAVPGAPAVNSSPYAALAWTLGIVCGVNSTTPILGVTGVPIGTGHKRRIFFMASGFLPGGSIAGETGVVRIEARAPGGAWTWLCSQEDGLGGSIAGDTFVSFGGHTFDASDTFSEYRLVGTTYGDAWMRVHHARLMVEEVG